MKVNSYWPAISMSDEIEGYETRYNHDGKVFFIETKTNQTFNSKLEVLEHFYKKICIYANTKPLGHSIHKVIR